ncbi:BT1A1 protein, partial [Atractosteus spatula]|nr:BT1A1 protein [Atractosteus spatula]
GCALSLSEKFQVLGSGVPVVVSPGEDTVLPCYLSPDISAEDLDIRWFRGEYEAPVCLYQSHKYNTDVQNPAYRDRANLFLHELHRGNVSLKLRNVSLSDHGLYNCLVESAEHNGDTLIDLVVRDVSVSLHSPGGGQTQLLCRAEGWFPAPAVMWIDKNGNEVPSLPITEDSNSQGLLSIKSYIPVKQESNIFSCLVRSTQPMADWELIVLIAPLELFGSSVIIIITIIIIIIIVIVKITMNNSLGIIFLCCFPGDFFPGPSGWMVALFIISAVTVAASVLLAIQWRRMDNNYVYNDHILSILFHWITRSTDAATVTAAVTKRATIHPEGPGKKSPGKQHRNIIPQERTPRPPSLDSVPALGSQPSESLHSPGGGQTQLLCRAEDWFPAPAASWTDKDGNELTSLSNTTVERDRQGLLNVSSYITAGQESNILFCLFRRSVPEPDWGSHLHIHTDVNLDPETAYCCLSLSEDGKRVRSGEMTELPDNPQRFDCCPCVVSREGFTSGRHYWEVEVNDDWAIGVTKETAERKECFNFSPKEGYWCLDFDPSRFSALTDPVTCLPLSLHPTKMGVCLDIEKRKVSFYKVESSVQIYTFIDMVFNQGETIYPVFCSWDYYGDIELQPPVCCGDYTHHRLINTG